jgi:putative peptidoglycan lipid II flippase
LRETHQILRSTRLITFITVVSRVMGYLRDLVVAVLLGTTLSADAFVIAFRIPNLLRRMFFEGAMTGAFVPVFTSYRVGRSEAESWEFARRMFWTLASLLAGVTLLGVILAPAVVRAFTLASPTPEQWDLAVLLTRITLPYCLLIALAALAGATLNAVGVFGLPAAMPLALNAAMITAGGLAWYRGWTEPAVALAVGVVAGGALQLGTQLPALRRRGMRFGFALGFAHEGVRRVGRLMLPAFAGVGIYPLNVLISTAFASQAPGWISALYFSNRLTELALGVYAISVATVVLPVMSQQAAARRLEEMRRTLTFALRNVLFIMLPATAGLVVLREPIVRVLFQHRAFGTDSTALTAWALLFYALGLPALAAARMLVQAFYAVEDTATPVRVALVALVANLVFCFALVEPLGQGGLALATTLAAYGQVAVLYAVLRRRVGPVEESRLALSVARAFAASAAMGGAIWLAMTGPWLHVSESLARLAGELLATIGAAALLFLVLAWALRAEELGELYTFLTGRPAGEKFAGVQAPVL